MSQVFPLSSHSLSAVFSLVSTSFKWFWRFLRTYVYTCTCDQSKQFYVYLSSSPLRTWHFFFEWQSLVSHSWYSCLDSFSSINSGYRTQKNPAKNIVSDRRHCTRIFTSSKAHKELVEYHEFNPRTAIPDSQKCYYIYPLLVQLHVCNAHLVR